MRRPLGVLLVEGGARGLTGANAEAPLRDHAGATIPSARSSLAALLILGALAAACGERDCEPPVCPAVACRDPFFLGVLDAEIGSPVVGASATGDVPCSTSSGGVDCDAGAPGTYDVTVSARGYSPSQVSVTVQPGDAPSECSCGRCPSWQPTFVELVAQ